MSGASAKPGTSAWAREQDLFLQNKQEFSHESKEEIFTWLKNAAFSILHS